MDISEREALEMYDSIARDFNSARVRTANELEPLVKGKANLFSVVVSILYDISRYQYISGNQCVNLIITIFQHVLPKYAELENANTLEEVKKLEEEIDRLTKIILKDWSDDGNTDNRQDGNKTWENR